MSTPMSFATPSKCSFRVEQSGDVLSLRRRTGSYSGAFFITIWLIGWTVGCITLAGLVAKQPTIQHLLFAIPFWASWFFAAAMLVCMYFGAEELLIGPEGLLHRTSALWTLTERHIPPDEIAGIAEFSVVTDSETGHTERGLEIATRGKPLRLGRNLSDSERLWLADLLHECFPGLTRNPPAPVPGVAEILHAGAPPEPPCDNSIRMEADWDGLIFTRRGSFSLAAFGAMSFFCLFWNGIVGVFALQLCDQFRWFLFLFLIPFAAIGLAIFWGWCLTAIAPFLEETWAIGRGEIIARSLAFGLGTSRRLSTDDVGSLELRKTPASKVKEESPHIPQEEQPYRLGFIGHDGRDLLVIRGLTLGEARWMGGHTASLLKDALAKGAKRSLREGRIPAAPDDPEFGPE